jgi:hypothetical protein
MPALTITQPGLSISEKFSDHAAIVGNASDPIAVTAVTWATATAAHGDATGTAGGTTEWCFMAPLLVGDNVITVTAHNAAGGAASAEIMIVRRTPPA